MNKIAVFALAAGTALCMADAASAQRVRPGWNQLGSPVCPSNFEYYRGWCQPVYGGGRGYRSYGSAPRYGRTVPPRWNYQGSAVCPSNYDYVAGMNRCVARY